MPDAQNVIATVIHDQLGQTLMNVFSTGGRSPLAISTNPGETLLAQLQQPGLDPPRIGLSFVLDILTNAVSALGSALPASSSSPASPAGMAARFDLRQVVTTVRTAVGRAGLFDGQPGLAVDELFESENPTRPGNLLEGLFQRLRDGADGENARGAVSRLQQMIGHDLGTALPVATLVIAVRRALGNAAGVPEAIEHGVLDYFFRTDGFETVDGERIVSPVHLSDVGGAIAGGQGVDALRTLFSKATAERYLRDITRVVVEAGYDRARGFRGDAPAADGLYTRVKARLTNHDKFGAWFRGFSSLAEAGAMRAVEVGTQGVATFQTNPLIAAGAGSFAGTVARKLAQDSFLTELREQLGLGTPR